jgi:hypothetical protein
MLFGTHEPGTSHHGLVPAFADEEVLLSNDEELAVSDYWMHGFR